MEITTRRSEMIVVPTEKMAQYASHGFTLVSNWYGGTVLMEKPQ